MRGALAVLLVIGMMPALAEHGVPSSFQDYVPYLLGDEFEFGTVYLAPELSSVTRVEVSDAPDIYRTLQTITSGNHAIEIGFDPGPSEDPVFVIRLNGVEAGAVDGTVLYVSAMGILYSKTGSNEYFEKARKFRIVGKVIEEVVQPFYLVDSTCRTSAILTMYTERCNKGQQVATLPSDSEVRVLLAEYGEAMCDKVKIDGNDNDDPVMAFLVATPFGLTGWVVSAGGYLDRPGRPLACITFRGD